MAALQSILDAHELVENRGYDEALFFVCNQIKKKKTRLDKEPASGHRLNLRLEIDHLNEVKQAIINNRE